MSILQFEDLSPEDERYATLVIDRLLTAAVRSRVSDIHLTQQGQRVGVRWRIDGRLLDLPSIEDGRRSKLLSRLKALAGLITYQTDVPQDGRIRLQGPEQGVEARVSTLPILDGERAVVRLAQRQFAEWTLQDLGFAQEVFQRFSRSLEQPSGVIVISGPAGAGKTTTAYAALRRLLASSRLRSVVTLEDPIECEIRGTAQAQVNVDAHFDWSTGLKALLRQDPEVMLVGEVRDPETARAVFQAAMTGQLVLTTLHARSCADALRRLLDLGVLTQHLVASLDLLICQRLVPRQCACQRTTRDDTGQAAAQHINHSGPSHDEALCSQCQGFGTDGRTLICEMLPEIDNTMARVIVQNQGADQLQSVAQSQGMQPLAKAAQELIRSGLVSSADVQALL